LTDVTSKNHTAKLLGLINAISNCAESFSQTMKRKMIEKEEKEENVRMKRREWRITMGRKVSTMLALASILLLTSMITPLPVNASPTNGPRSQQLLIKYYNNEFALYADLTALKLEIDACELTKLQELMSKANPNDTLAKVEKLYLRSFSLNNNLTINAYPRVVSPMSDVNFRKAIAHLVDKDYYRDVIWDGAAVRADTWIPSPCKDWWNWTIATGVHMNGTVFNNYPYPCSTYQANLELNQTGWLYGTDSNPYYDPAYPGSATMYRAYPLWHSKAGQTLDPLVFYSRNDDGLRDSAGMHFRDMLRKSGIPVTFYSVSMSQCNDNVVLGRNYHIYTAGWSLGTYPTYLYNFFHSDYWFPGGSNYHCSAHNGYTDLNYWGDRLNEAVTLMDAMYAAQRLQSLVVDKYCIGISLLNFLGFHGYRNLCGIVNYFAVGPENQYTYLNAYRADNPPGSYALPIRVGVVGAPTQLNPIYSSLECEISTMSPFMSSFMSANPYEIFRDQPWLCKDWDDRTWVDPEDGNKVKSKITYYLRSDAEWIQPITGVPLGGVDNTFYEFSAWYHYQTPYTSLYSGYRGLHHIRCDPDGTGNLFKIEVYMDTRSMFNLLKPWGGDLFPPAWKRNPLSKLETRVFVEGVNVTTPGDLPLPVKMTGAPVEIVSVLEDGSPLKKYTDYDMIKGRIRILKDIANGKKITVQYWARGDASGYTPGNVPWNEILIGYGPWYMTEHVLGAGGWTAFKANTNFFLETAPLAELDWYWYWHLGDAPRSGYYKVDLYDAVRLTAAYGSTGYLVPSIPWEPTADLMIGMIPPLTAPGPGKIDYRDKDTLLAQYGATFGTPPPP